MNRAVVIDLETIPDPTMIPLLPEILEPAEPKMPALDSRLTDPVKIEADRLKKAAKWEGLKKQVWEEYEEKKSDQVRDMWKNPKQNIIVCAGWHDGENTGSFFAADPSPPTQKKLLQDFWDHMALYGHYVTFNGIAFDVPALTLRSLKSRIRPSVRIDTGMYRVTNHTDCRMILGNWDKFAQGGLDYYMKYFELSDGKNGLDGSMVQYFYAMGPRGEKIIRQYCEKDCRDTWLLYELIKKYGMV